MDEFLAFFLIPPLVWFILALDLTACIPWRLAATNDPPDEEIKRSLLAILFGSFAVYTRFSRYHMRS
jgi:hypothetical protein